MIAATAMGLSSLIGGAGAAHAAEPPRVLASPTVVRPSSDRYPELVDMHFRVEAFTTDPQAGTLYLRDATGRLVKSMTVRHCPTLNPCTPDWEFSLQPYDAQGAVLTPGTYTASADLPDSAGALVRVTFPSFRVQAYDDLAVRAFSRAARADVAQGTVVGRCSRLRSAGGVVRLLSQARCGSRRAGADVVTRVFSMTMPTVTGYERLDDVAVRLFFSRPTARGRVRVSTRVPALDQGWHRAIEPVRVGRSRQLATTAAVGDRLTDVRGQVVQIRVSARRGARIVLRRVAVVPTYLVWR